jgi:hypothetical protein
LVGQLGDYADLLVALLDGLVNVNDFGVRHLVLVVGGARVVGLLYLFLLNLVEGRIFSQDDHFVREVDVGGQEGFLLQGTSVH